MSSQFPNNESLLIVLNKLFDALKKKSIKSLNDLTSEKLLKAIILEIEPKFESIAGKFDLIDDSNFGIRYANLVQIISLLEAYKETSPDKDKFTLNTHFKNILVVNDLLKNDKDQLQILGEVLLFISAISSRRELYIDRIGDLDDLKLFNYFFQVIEKFKLIDRNDDTNNLSHLERSCMLNNQLNRMKDDCERQISSLIQINKETEAKYATLLSRNEVLERELFDYEAKLKDKEHDLETIKASQAQSFKYQEQLFKDTLTNSELSNQLQQKDLEINELKKELNLINKKHSEEIIELKDKNEILEEKLKEIKTIQTKYEKLNMKYKEIHTSTKDKRQSDFNNDRKDYLTKENQNLQAQVEKIMKELLTEKERYFKQEEEKKKIERNAQELAKQLKQAQAQAQVPQLHSTKHQLPHQSKHQAPFYSNIGSNKELNLNNISEVNEDKRDGFEIEDDSILNDLKENIRRGTVTEKEYAELKAEKNDLLKQYKSQIDDIHKLTSDKEKLLTENETNKMEIDRLNREMEKLEIEKEKAGLQIQKVELNCQKLQIEFDKVSNERKTLEAQYKSILSDSKKELEQYKSELTSHKNLNEKMLAEKNGMINDFKALQKENERFKSESNQKKSKVVQKGFTSQAGMNSTQPQSAVQSETEILQLKNEIQNLKLQSLQKDDTIKTLKEMANDVKNSEDIDYYKKLYEDQKARVNDEHKLITESLYKLAVHFMSLKDDLQKKINQK